MTDIKDADKISFLDSPVSPTGLFRPEKEGFAKRFTGAQKSSQAMQHFLPKRSSSVAGSSHPKTAQTPQPAKTVPPTTQTEAKLAPRDRSHSARRARDPGPRLCWTQRLRRRPDLWDRKRERPSPSAAGPTPKLSRLNLTFCSGCRGQCVFCSHWARPAYRCYITFYKHSQKEIRFPLPHNMSGASPHGDKPLEAIQLLVKWAKAWQAIPGVSDWVMGIIK